MSLEKFRNLYQVNKTLRFELKPIGATLENIKKKNIIFSEEDEYKGKDADRAQNYKYIKILLDKMHWLFINDALESNFDEKTQDELLSYLNNSRIDRDLLIPKETGNLLAKLFDNTAKNWIEQYVTDMPLFWDKEIQKLNKKISECSDSKKIKGYTSAIKKLEKRKSKPEKAIKKNNREIIFSNEDALKLLKWKILKGEVQASFQELEQADSDKLIPQENLLEFIRTFNKFTTYFTGFNKNRENIYHIPGSKEKPQSTSIANRVFIENLQFHLQNIEKWELIKKSVKKYQNELKVKGSDWQKALGYCEKENNIFFEQLFSKSSFIDFMNQPGIDQYNSYLGGKPALDGSRKIQGINEVINLCRQQAGATRREFPVMHDLYKMILSKNDKKFIDFFESDKDLLNSVKKFYSDSFQNEKSGPSILDNFILEVRNHYSEIKNSPDKYFVDVKNLTKLSMELTGSWDNLGKLLLSNMTEKQYHARKLFSFEEIQSVLKHGVEENLFKVNNLSDDYGLEVFFQNKLASLIENVKEAWGQIKKNRILDLEMIDHNRSKPGEKGYEQIHLLKTFLDNAIQIHSFIRLWALPISSREIEGLDINWYENLEHFLSDFPIIQLYNMARNYLTQKASAEEKVKINFENSQLLAGWGINQEHERNSLLFIKNNSFYLGIMDKNTNHIFDYNIKRTDSQKKLLLKKELQKQCLAEDDDNYYQKMDYWQIANVTKDIYTLYWDELQNKAVRKTKKITEFWGPEITRIKESKSYSENTNDRLKYFSYLIKCAKSYWKHFDLKLKDAKEYLTIQDLFSDIQNQGYKLQFTNIKESYVSEKVSTGELYLFQIYNKDFSNQRKKPRKERRDNLHTSYWKLLFSEENLKDVVMQLNGQAEIFFRKALIKYSEEQRQKGHHAVELSKHFKYPILKDKRFSQDKFYFHCPITLNFKAEKQARLNEMVQNYLREERDIKIIGIDRGEKHLLYYSVIEKDGNILEQGSLNSIDNGFIRSGSSKPEKINYKAKLDEKEKGRDQARKNWSTIENIKELKAGYLSQVVHKLARLIIKHNAIVVLEDLNIGFKRGRFGVEKQVYQKFERALIEKLNYLTFKDRKNRSEPGHYLNAYQLTNKFESFQKLGKQSGILFYTTAAYTSTTDPVTGFLRNVYYSYSSVSKTINFWKSFDSIIYNAEKDRFEFTYTLGRINSQSMGSEENQKKVVRKTWTVCSSVIRSRYIRHKATEHKKNDDNIVIGRGGKHEIFDVTEEIKKKFNESSISYQSQPESIIEQLCSKTERKDADLHKSLVYYFNSILRLRVTDGAKESGSNENDFILSPVEPFFDSRKNYNDLPENGDANGAYNIARKGLCIIENILESAIYNRKAPAIDKLQWQNFCQNKAVVEKQKKKLKNGNLH